MNFELPVPLPDEIKKEYALAEILFVKKTSIICSLKKKLPFSDACYILKIIPARQYNKTLYERLAALPESGILTPVQEYHTKHFIFFIFPKLQSLSYLVKSGKIDFRYIKTLCSDLGKTLLTLHQANIFHMDISPDNLYLNQEEHFLLGDFSSAHIKETHGRKRFLVPHPTGSTKGFYPEEISKDKSPVNYDIYGFCMILFLLLNHGKTPFHKTNPKFPIDSGNTCIFNISNFLSELLLTCKTAYLSSVFFQDKYFELKQMMQEEQTFRTEIPDFENSLFCTFTEPEERRSFFSKYRYKEPLISSITFEKKEHILSIPKSLCKPALYGLFMFCGFLFLFACYHTLSVDKTSTDNIRQVKVNIQIEIPSSSPFQTPAITSPAILPANTPVPSVKPKIFLNLRRRNLNNTSFLAEVNRTEEIQIIFADQNKFATISSFLLFQNLKELYLNQNKITSISVKEVKTLKHLEILDLSENSLQDLSALSYFTRLKLLDLSGQKHLKNIRRLGNLKTLNFLILTNTNVTKKEISYLKKHLPVCTILY